MSEKSHVNHLLLLTAATLFISTSGALGKFINMSPPVIIWWRAALAAVFLFIFCLYKGIGLKIKNSKDRRTFIIAALLMGGHWVTYFYALKLSNVAIGMLSIFTFPVMIGQVANYNGTMLMFYQALIVTILLAPILYVMDSSNIKTQYPYVIMLALLTTAIGHTMFVNSLKYFKASTASIIGSAQPVFGIIIAYFFLNEIPTIHTFVGGTLILATVVIESIRSKSK